jgi:hypothetical protein
MSAVDVTLSKSGEELGIFHDLRYTNDNEGGNSNASMLEITNQSGNDIFIEGCLLEQDPHTKKWSRTWYDLTSGRGLDGIRIHITGGIENSEFLQMLRLILEAEKMVDIVKP